MTERSSALAQSLTRSLRCQANEPQANEPQANEPDGADRQLVQDCQWLDEATADEVNDVLDAMQLCTDRQNTNAATLLAPILAALVQRQIRTKDAIPEQTRDRIVLLYRSLAESQGDRWRLLQWLTSGATPVDLRTFVELLIESPPSDWRTAASAFAPLFQRRDYDATVVFPQLLEALQHLSVAAPILDLANYLMRRSIVEHHPAECRAEQLTELLGNVVGQLARLEEAFSDDGESTESASQQIDDSVALVIALCDAVALIGNRIAIGKLRAAMELGHRRIRTEAATALARFGEEDGIDTLIEMASEPVARLRVLADAKELGILDRINPRFTTAQAKAEASVALELSQSGYFGIPPGQLELVDSRNLYWPGYEQPQDCHLFRFTYRLDSAKYSNIAISGPVVHAFVADLNDVPIDDIYAAYAGWHVEHPEIFEVDQNDWTTAQQTEADRLMRRLEDSGYRQIKPVMLGFFVGDRSLVAVAVFGGAPGTAIVDQHSIEWHPARSHDHPIGPTEALCIHRGRRLLNSFN